MAHNIQPFVSHSSLFLLWGPAMPFVKERKRKETSNIMQRAVLVPENPVSVRNEFPTTDADNFLPSSHRSFHNNTVIHCKKDFQRVWKYVEKGWN